MAGDRARGPPAGQRASGGAKLHTSHTLGGHPESGGIHGGWRGRKVRASLQVVTVHRPQEGLT